MCLKTICIPHLYSIEVHFYACQIQIEWEFFFIIWKWNKTVFENRFAWVTLFFFAKESNRKVRNCIEFFVVFFAIWLVEFLNYWVGKHDWSVDFLNTDFTLPINLKLCYSTTLNWNYLRSFLIIAPAIHIIIRTSMKGNET